MRDALEVAEPLEEVDGEAAVCGRPHLAAAMNLISRCRTAR
jgi:hypothetical protein